MRPLTAFASYPNGVRFETQDEEEVVVLFLRQHFVVNIPWLFMVFIMIVAPTVIFPLVFRFLELPFPLPLGYAIIGTLFWYTLTFGFALAKFIHWFFNIYIVTNQRIVDIDFVNLLYKQFSEAQLSNIQDISYRMRGIVATVVNYGNVIIQTAGELPNFEFAAVPNPSKVVEAISELADKANGGGV